MLFETCINDPKKTHLSSTVATLEFMGIGFEKETLMIQFNTGALSHRMTLDRKEIDQVIEILKPLGLEK